MGRVNNEYTAMLTRIIQSGSIQIPRGIKTHELLGYSAVIDMTDPILTLAYRKLNYKFMCAEAAWILHGQNDVETISRYCNHIAQFSDDQKIFAGAYGPKWVAQRRYAVRMLKSDPSSRQAIINIWKDHPSPSKDIPCTLSWQFLIRNGKLNMISTMRSSDAWLGWPYDVFNQCMTAAWVLLETDKHLKLGKLILNCGSQHLYERDVNNAQVVLDNRHTHVIKPFDVTEFNSGQDLIDTLWEKANGKSPVFDV